MKIGPSMQEATTHGAFTIAVALIAALPLAGCINSSGPILTDAKPLLGEAPRFVFYELGEGGAKAGAPVSYRWDGGRYAPAAAQVDDFGPFTVHEFEGRDLIVQGFHRSGRVEYALARKVASGAFFVVVIDDVHADDPTRQRFCATLTQFSCRIETRDALLAFARATAARQNEYGVLAVQLAPDKE